MSEPATGGSHPRLARRLAWARALRRGKHAPTLLGLLTAIVGAINVGSVMSPDMPARGQLVAALEPAGMAGAARALALPAGVGLIILGVYVGRRRQRAWLLATAVLLAVGVFDIVKGLDVEETLISWMLAGVLIWARPAFCVVHPRGFLGRASRRIALLVAGALAGSAFIVWVANGAGPDAGLAGAARNAAALLTLSGAPVRPQGHVAWLPLCLGLVGIGVAALASAIAFEPIALHSGADVAARAAARALVRRHGDDTLSYFKLRADLGYLFSPDRRAFLGYRVAGRTLVVAGDPVGAADALPALVAELVADAERHGLAVAIVGAGTANLALYREAGLRALYIGDEAIVDTAGFSLEGRPIRKVRQSVTRLERAGYRHECSAVASLSATQLAELDEISARWRAGSPERGFSMALDHLRSDASAHGRVVIARDDAGRARGFLHFVPCPGRQAMSLSAMRRDPDTPNGLTEFLIVGAIDTLRAEGVAELSLNFASFARLLRSPRGRLERIARRAVVAADRHFQIDSLYRFNAKFFPRWEPRYLLYQGPLGLPRAGIAALRAEGQLPRLPLDVLMPLRATRSRPPVVDAGG